MAPKANTPASPENRTKTGSSPHRGPPHHHKHQDKWFNPSTFVGEWRDTLGHTILVWPRPNAAAAAAAAADGSAPVKPTSFVAAMAHRNGANKQMVIHYDKEVRTWICGNGTMCRKSATESTLLWKTADGRSSTWTRVPPSGVVFFDVHVQEEAPIELLDAEAVEFVPQGQGNVLDELVAKERVRLEAEAAASTAAASAPSAGALAARASKGKGKAAREARASAHAPAPAPVKPAPPVPAAPVDASLDTSSKPYIKCPGGAGDNNQFVWQLDEPWPELREMGAATVGSPEFEVMLADKSLGKAQLVFCPEGSKHSAQSCVVNFQWNASQSGVGIKFQVAINGDPADPKLCLGHKLESAFKRPAASCEDITITCDIIGVVG